MPGTSPDTFLKMGSQLIGANTLIVGISALLTDAEITLPNQIRDSEHAAIVDRSLGWLLHHFRGGTMAVLRLAILQPSIPHATLPLIPMSTIYFQPSCRGGQDECELKKDFPQTVELILVDVEAPTPEAAEAPGPGLLVMQGGGAQGAYQRDVYRAPREALTIGISGHFP